MAMRLELLILIMLVSTAYALEVITNIYEGLDHSQMLVFEYCKKGAKIVHCETEEFSPHDESYLYDNPYIEPEDYYEDNKPEYRNNGHQPEFYMFPYRSELYDLH